jgi:hypothetical protein
MEPRPIKCLGDFHEDVIRFDLTTFIQHHGEAFLLHHGPLDQLQVTRDRKSTLLYEITQPTPEGESGPDTEYLVFPLRNPAGSGTEAETISLGRSEANEVTIPDDSISAVHAFVQPESEGSMSIQDMNSTNGTFVNGTRIAAQGDGPPVLLKSGDRIRLGARSFTFLPAAEFRKLISALLGS